MSDDKKYCGAMNRSGNSCLLPAMQNGRCRLHGGMSSGPTNPRVKHGLYRKHMSSDEQEMFDTLKADVDYANMRAEAALLRIMIERCARAILGGNELESFRVPMQVLPSYMEKLIKVLDKVESESPEKSKKKEYGTSMDDELAAMIKEEESLQELERERAAAEE